MKGAPKQVEKVASGSVTPLTLADHLALWDRLRDLPPAAFYQLRMLLLDSETAIDEGQPVLTREFQVGPGAP